MSGGGSPDDGDVERGGPGSRVLVLGSANVDALIRLDRFPRPGETVFGRSGGDGLGGKGANQAVASALVGARTTFLGAVGRDADGALVREALGSHGVDVSRLQTRDTAATGKAYITVDRDGENSIIVVSGANTELTTEAVRALVAEPGLLEGAAVALGQGELLPEAIDAFALAAGDGLRFVLNLAPVIAVAPATLRAADPLVVNEHEAAALLGLDAERDLADVDSALAVVRRLGRESARSAVVTLGAEGAVAAEAGRSWHEPSPRPARVVDSTGAGDAFVGVLAASLAAGEDLAEAVRRGAAAGSLAVEGMGTVASYARLRELSPGAPLPAEGAR